MGIRVFRRFSWIALLGVLAAGPAAADLDVVFVLDTTGSMSNELREAKERVRQLAVSMQTLREGERVRFGVVAFRDKGDAYVTKGSPLSDNIALSGRFLATLTAGGGGDGPESVVAGLAVAIRDMDWDRHVSTDRRIFLIGDAPPHLDYADQPAPEALIAEARAAGIAIDAIGCRSLSGSGIAFFRRMAFGTEGRYQHIGRVRAGDAGLTEALTRAVAPRPAAAIEAGRPQEVIWVDRRPAEGTSPTVGVSLEGARAVEAVRGQAVAPSCLLAVALPAGVTNGTPPRVWRHDKGLRVVLELIAGDGGVERWRLDGCPPSDTRIDVVVEVD